MSDSLTPVRRVLALAALTLGGFAIGISLFTVGGLLPDIARDLLPERWSTDPAAAIGSAGWVVTAFTLGAVVGAPLLAATTGRLSRKWLLLGLIAVFVTSSVLVAVLSSFPLVVAARFVNGIPFGVYVSTAILAAADLMPSGQRGRGVAIVTAGPPVAVLLGAPLATVTGQLVGWRTVFLLIAAVFGLAFAAIALAVPFTPGNPAAGLREELVALQLPQVWLAVIFGVLGFGGMFAVITYIAPISTTVTGISAAAIPIVQFALGVGMTLGSLAAGWLADSSVDRVLLGFVVGLTLAQAGFALFASTVTGLLLFTALIGFFNAGTATATQVRMIDIAHNAKALGAALNQSALSLGNSVGSFLGGVAIAYGLGYLAPAALGVAVSAIGLIIVGLALTLGRTDHSFRWQPAPSPATQPAPSHR
jgi:MFS transporter, DHA1 family, inner membrane transport protein